MEVNFQHCSQNVAIFDPSTIVPPNHVILENKKRLYQRSENMGNTKQPPSNAKALENDVFEGVVLPTTTPRKWFSSYPQEPVANGDKRCCTCKMWSAMCHPENPSWKNTWPWWHNTSRNQNSKLRRNIVIFKICIPSTSSSQTIY